jgi:RNA polymerase sigma-70 factor (ECF subfamily)
LPMTATALPDDAELLAALRRGDEAAFVQLVERYQGPMLRLARLYVADQTTAEEVVQETWLGALRGLDRFEGRSSLKTWLFNILTNRAKTRAVRDGRTIPFSALTDADEGDEAAVDPDRFHPLGHPDAGHWVSRPQSWRELPEERLLARETRERLQAAIDELPPTQRAVLTLRDVDGWSAEEVCNTLEISETNQRVLLHRARAKVRRALESYLAKA